MQLNRIIIAITAADSTCGQILIFLLPLIPFSSPAQSWRRWFSSSTAGDSIITSGAVSVDGLMDLFSIRRPLAINSPHRITVFGLCLVYIFEWNPRSSSRYIIGVCLSWNLIIRFRPPVMRKRLITAVIQASRDRRYHVYTTRANGPAASRVIMLPMPFAVSSTVAVVWFAFPAEKQAGLALFKAGNLRRRFFRTAQHRKSHWTGSRCP